MNTAGVTQAGQRKRVWEFRLFGSHIHLLSASWVTDKDHSLQKPIKLQVAIFSFREMRQALFGVTTVRSWHKLPP